MFYKKRIIIIIQLVFVSVLQAQTTICWDTSLSMQERDVNKDFSVLSRVFEKNKDQEVQVLFFNVDVTEKLYMVTNGDWNTLKEDLLSVNYDGATVFSNVANKIKYDNVYVFTDGKANFSSDVLALKPKNILINTSSVRNIDFLNRTALLTKSRLMDFASMLPENSTISKLSKEELVKGTVYIDNQPASNISISLVDDSEAYLTDEEGNFSIKAQVGDSILVSSVVNRTYRTIPVLSKAATKVFLEPNIYSLDEVVVIEQRRKDRLVNTALGKQNKDKLGYAVQSIGDEEITEINTNVNDAVVGKFAGVTQGGNDEGGGGRVLGQNDLSQVVMRGGALTLLGNNYGLVVMDGVPLRRSNSSTGEYADTSWINPSNIADITVLKGLAATNRYGSLGSAGVILITSKTALAAQGSGSKTAERKNVFDGKLNIKSNTLNTAYINELKVGSDFDSSYAIYLNQRSVYKDKSYYFIDLYDFFKPMNGKVAARIASNILEKENVNYEQLRSLFLKVVKNKDTGLQELTSKKMLEDYPENIQSYYDRAIMQRNSEEYQQALDMFLAIMDGSASYGLNFSGLHKIVTAEIKNLIYDKKDKLDLSEVPENYLKNLEYKARLVFDWTNSNSEFEFQFVNPQKLFFEWKHDNFENKQRIEDELKNGFASEQFDLFGDESKGKWIINVSYLGNSNNQDVVTPIFIKCRIDYDYGTPNSRSQDYMLRLTEPTDKQFFFEFTL